MFRSENVEEWCGMDGTSTLDFLVAFYSPLGPFSIAEHNVHPSHHAQVCPICASYRDPYRQPRWGQCQFGRGLHVRPKWAAHTLAYMGVMWAHLGGSYGLPIWAHMGSPDGPNVNLGTGSMSMPSGEPCVADLTHWAASGTPIWVK